MKVRLVLRFFVCLVCAGALLAAGCNTMEGLGKDIKKGGENLENSAASHK